MTQEQTPESTPAFGPELIGDFTKAFGTFIKNSRLYPPTSDIVRTSSEELRALLDRVFLWRNPLTIAIMHEQLYFEEFPLNINSPLVQSLTDDLLDRMIRKLVLGAGVSDSELRVLAEMFNKPPMELRDMGGPYELLFVDNDVQNISITEVSFLKMEDVEEAKSWKAQLEKTGLDIRESVAFIVGPARLGQEGNKNKSFEEATGVLRIPRLSRHEMNRFVEVLMNPEILAEMILDLSKVKFEGEVLVDPQEVIRIVTRIENTLLANSIYPEKVIAKKMTESLELFDTDLRAAVLEECYRLRDQGVRVPNLELYQFTLKEFVLVIHNILSTDPKDPALRMFKFNAEQYSKFARMFYKFNEQRGGVSGEQLRKLSESLQRYRLKPTRFESRRDAHVDFLKQVKQYLEDGLQRQISEKRDRLPMEISTSYIFTLLGILQMETRESRIRELLHEYFEQIEQKLDHAEGEALELLSRIRTLQVEERAAEATIRTLVAEKMAGSIGEKIEHTIKSGFDAMSPEKVAELIPAVMLLGDDAFSEMLDRCYFKSARPKKELLIDELASARKKIVELVLRYVNERDELFSPDRYFRAMDLYLTLFSDGARQIVRQCMEASIPEVRKATLLCLENSEADKLAEEVFLDVLRDRFSKTTREEKIIALYGLGRLGCEECLEEIKELIAKRSFFGKSSQQELGLCALYVYAQIAGPKAKSEFPELFKRFKGENFQKLLGLE